MEHAGRDGGFPTWFIEPIGRDCAIGAVDTGSGQEETSRNTHIGTFHVWFCIHAHVRYDVIDGMLQGLVVDGMFLVASMASNGRGLGPAVGKEKLMKPEKCWQGCEDRSALGV